MYHHHHATVTSTTTPTTIPTIKNNALYQLTLYAYNYPNNASDDLSFRLSRMTSCTSNPVFLSATSVVVVLELLSANHYQLARRRIQARSYNPASCMGHPQSNSKNHYTDNATGTAPSLSERSASPAATADTYSASAPSEASNSPS